MMYWSVGIYCLIGMMMVTSCMDISSKENNPARIYYVDSKSGNDLNDGLSPQSAWRSLLQVERQILLAGDTVRFKRGSRFSETLTIETSGSKEKPIVFDDYGDLDQQAPAFTNHIFDESKKQYGNCIRLKGDHIVVRDLYFHGTPADLPPETGGFLTMWELGAIYIDRTADHCKVLNNEIKDCGVGIKSYGPFALIMGNYIHDCNRVLKEWSWGPIGIWLGNDHQEICYNTIINYSAIDPRITWGPNSYGGGADGSAIEIDDARIDKSDISIHHNYTRDNQGFLEVTWTDVEQNPDYINFRIHHNISDDYQQFVALWRGAGFQIDHNTIIRRKANANDWGVFNITQYDGQNLVRNNIIVTEQNISVFLLGRTGDAQPNTIIENNLYFAADDSLNMSLDGPGMNPIFGDPHLKNYGQANQPSDYAIGGNSMAINRGQNLGYKVDFSGTTIQEGVGVDIGAYEYDK